MTDVTFQNVVKTPKGYKVFCENYKAAKVLNKKYPTYKVEGRLYSFKEGDEAIFYLPENEYYFILKTLKQYNCLY